MDLNETWSRLILFSENDTCVPVQLARLWGAWKRGETDRAALRRGVNAQLKRLMDFGSAFSLSGNLWQEYLSWLLLQEEHAWALANERTEGLYGALWEIARADCAAFYDLFHFDFSPLEEELGIRTFSLLRDQEDGVAPGVEPGSRIHALTGRIARVKDGDEICRLVADEYRRFGAGLFGLYRAFRVRREDRLVFEPIPVTEQTRLDDLVGYELQKKTLRDNVGAFVSGRPFNNTLLYGDAGTGKSTCVRGLMNEYWTRGLRIIEVTPLQFSLLNEIIAQVRSRRYFFVLLLDDLSFDDGDVEYRYLKAVIEGGLETRPDNVMICVTSNRRHLIRETWKDRADMDYAGEIHQSDTVEEKLSLAGRFGCTVRFSAPDRELFNRIVRELAVKHPEIQLSEEELLHLASRWEIRHGGLSGRTAQQFINDLAGRQ